MCIPSAGGAQLDDKTIAESKYVIGGEGLTSEKTPQESVGHSAATAAGAAARHAVLKAQGVQESTSAATSAGNAARDAVLGHDQSTTKDSNIARALLVNTSNTSEYVRMCLL
jgi:hypothetical protein